VTSLIAARTGRLLDALSTAGFDVFIATSPVNVMYATGYMTPVAQIAAIHPMAAIITPGARRLVLPVADSAPAIDFGIPPEEIVAFGRFYFESPTGEGPSTWADRYASLADAVAVALRQLDVTAGRIGLDSAGLGPNEEAVRASLPPGAEVVDATAWARSVRACKTEPELALLRHSAQLSVQGIDHAVTAAAPGMTERDLARLVAGTMVDGYATPKFVIVTSGPRSALADALTTDRAIQPGDLVRFDVGCLYEGYWSDIGRTAVVGEPTALQQSRYDAVYAAEQAQLDTVRAGVTAGDLFTLGVQTAEGGGLRGYRRQHCGHGIGAEVYEHPIIAAGVDVPLLAGMTYCFETPFYELGWGGMMVEDTVAVTADGAVPFTDTDRTLRVIPA
jgi:Xaa-Pro aminopeptidase